MMSDDELRSELTELAEQIEITPAPLERVQARSRRRTMYQRGGMVLAAFALVVGGTVAVTSIGGDGEDLDVATDESDTTSTDGDAPAGDDADEGDVGESDDADARAESSTTDAAEESADVETALAYDEAGYYGGPHRIVAWGDGFLAFGERYIESDPPELVFDGASPIGDYFSQEIIDTVAESGATTIDEAMGALDEAGLLEEATAIVTENPEVLEWYNDSIGGGTYESFAEFSSDGVTWEPIDLSWPTADPWFHQVASNGDQLVAVDYQPEWDPETGQSLPAPVTVHVTSDLSTWTSVEVPYSAPTVADYVQLDVSPQQLVVTDDSWLLTINSWQWIDVWAALPADVVDEMNTNGFDWMPTEAGVEIVDWGWAEYEGTFTTTTTIAPVEADADAGDAEEAGTDEAATDEAMAEELDVWEEPEPTTIRVIPWSELPFSYEDYMGADYGGGNGVQAFLGDLASGDIAEVESPGEGEVGQISVTDAGLFTVVWEQPEIGFEESDLAGSDAYRPTITAWFSPDGRSWQPRDLPDLGDDDWLDSSVAVENGVLLTMSSGFGGQRFFVGAADGTGFTEVDGPDLPEFAHVWFPTHYAMGDGAASVIDLGSASEPFFPTYEVTFEHDGFVITTSQTGEGDGTLSVVDGDGATVFEHTGHVYEEPPFQYDGDGVTIIGDDGATILTIPHEVMEEEIWRVESQAWEEYNEANPYVPDFWLIATRDGRSWTSMQLPALEDEYGWYGDAVVAGDRVLVSNGTGEWQIIPLS